MSASPQTSAVSSTYIAIDQASAALYTPEQVYALDQAAIDSGIPSIQLMKRAGRAAFELLVDSFPQVEQVTVYCGGGKNAGDGYVLAALAAQRVIPVKVIALVAAEQLQGDAKLAYDYAVQEGVTIESTLPASAPISGVIIDALLGIGFKSTDVNGKDINGGLRENFAAAVAQINAAKLPVIAIDIPTGLDANTGAAGAVVHATKTITYIAPKRGLFTGRGPAVTGDIYLASLDVPAEIYSQQSSSAARLNVNELISTLPARQADAHKGSFGHVLIIGGDHGMGGAVIMAAEAAARAGAGLVTVATRPEHVVPLLVRRPEVMTKGVNSGLELEPLLARASVLVLGLGLGRSAWSEQMLQVAVKSGLPMVVDADGLNLIAEAKVVQKNELPAQLLITPHPAEAARLLASETQAVNQNRFAAVTQLAADYSCVCILKGAGSLVAGAEGQVGVVAHGNPGMATGGMGDVLSGICGALIAQGLTLETTAQLAACVHAKAGDMAAEKIGQRGLLATDIIPFVSELLA